MLQFLILLYKTIFPDILKPNLVSEILFHRKLNYILEIKIMFTKMVIGRY